MATTLIEEVGTPFRKAGLYFHVRAIATSFSS